MLGPAAAVYAVMALRSEGRHLALGAAAGVYLWSALVGAGCRFRRRPDERQRFGPAAAVILSLVVTVFAGWRVAEALDQRARPPARLADYDTADWAPLIIGWILPDDVPVDVGGYHLRVMTAEGTGKRCLSGPWPEPGPIAWSPDGGRIVFAGRGRGPGRQGLFAGMPDRRGETVFQPTDEPVEWLVWSADGALVRYAAGGRDWFTRGDGAEPLTGREGRQAFWPEGKPEVMADQAGVIRFVDRDGQVTAGRQATYAHPAWSADGRFVAATRTGSTGSAIELIPVAGGSSRNVPNASRPAFSPDGTQLAFVRRHEAVVQRLQTSQGMRQWEVGGDLHVLDLPTGAERRLTWRLKHVDDLHWLPDSRRLVFWGEGQRLRGADGRPVLYWGDPQPLAGWTVSDEAAILADATNGTLRRLADAQAVWCSPDGRRALLVESCGGQVKPERMLAVDLASGASRPFTNLPPHELVAAAWSPDGRSVALVRRDKSRGDPGRPNLERFAIWLTDGDGLTLRRLGGQPRHDRRESGHPYDRCLLRWASDGKSLVYLAAGEPRGAVRRLDLAGAETTLVAEGCHAFDLSPDGRLAVIRNSDQRGNVHLVSPDGRASRELVQDTAPRGRSPRLSPDGRLIALIAMPDAGSRLRVMNADGSDARDLPGPIDGCREVAWSPDGTLLAFIHGPEKGEEVGVVPVTGGSPRILCPSPGQYRTLVWSPDSGKLSFYSLGGSPGGTVVAEVTGTKLVGPLPHYRAAWFPDGQRLLLQDFGPSDLGARGLPVHGDLVTVRWDGAEPRHLSGVPAPFWEPIPAFGDRPSDGGAELSPDGRLIAYWHQGPAPLLGRATMPLCLFVFGLLGPLSLACAWAVPVGPNWQRRLARFLTTVVLLLFLGSVIAAALAHVSAGLSAMM